MKICGIENQDDIPPDFPTSAESCTALLQQVAKKVVDMVWRQYSKQEIASVIDANDDGVYDEPETDEEDLDSDRPSYGRSILRGTRI